MLGIDHCEFVLKLGNILMTHGFRKLFLTQIIMRPTRVTHIVKRILKLLLLSLFFRQQHSIIFRIINLRNQLIARINLNIVITSLIGSPMGTVVRLTMLLLRLFNVFCLLVIYVIEVVYDSGWRVCAEL